MNPAIEQVVGVIDGLEQRVFGIEEIDGGQAVAIVPIVGLIIPGDLVGLLDQVVVLPEMLAA
jgi:hypothetical protein